MLNARSLHAGLELEWGETSIDKLIAPTNNSKLLQADQLLNKSIYQQESWIAQLPSVLFICLNRYKFVKATQSSAKILEPFEFDQHIYLDRYMYTNREIVKSKRQELSVLNSELKRLEAKLSSIKCYRVDSGTGCSQASYALDDVLKCTLDFAGKIQSLSDEFGSGVERLESVDLVKACLKDLIDGVQKKLESLEASIREVRSRIDNIFDVDCLKKVKYSLHSVCIHEGNAVSGHFWTYIWNPQQLKW
jgi:ubiquitin carboxyl-terminal hydrolase 25/28